MKTNLGHGGRGDKTVVASIISFHFVRFSGNGICAELDSPPSSPASSSSFVPNLGNKSAAILFFDLFASFSGKYLRNSGRRHRNSQKEEKERMKKRESCIKGGKRMKRPKLLKTTPEKQGKVEIFPPFLGEGKHATFTIKCRKLKKFADLVFPPFIFEKKSRNPTHNIVSKIFFFFPNERGSVRSPGRGRIFHTRPMTPHKMWKRKKKRINYE